MRDDGMRADSTGLQQLSLLLLLLLTTTMITTAKQCLNCARTR